MEKGGRGESKKSGFRLLYTIKNIYFYFHYFFKRTLTTRNRTKLLKFDNYAYVDGGLESENSMLFKIW